MITDSILRRAEAASQAVQWKQEDDALRDIGADVKAVRDAATTAAHAAKRAGLRGQDATVEGYILGFELGVRCARLEL